MTKKISYNKDDTIFVQIASYRDPELQHTLQDMFKNAKRPENIFVGICHQYDMKGDEDKHLFEVEFPNKKQLRIDEVHYPDAQGLFFARRKTQLLYDNEKWTVQFDSHMRFEEGWDEIMVKMLKKLQNDGYKKPVVTSCSPGYNNQTNELCDPYITFLNIDRIAHQNTFKDFGIIRICGIRNYVLKHSTPTSFISGNFFAAPGSYVKEVLYDVHMYFADEQNIAVRLWTSGYDIFNSDKNICYHLWNKIENGEEKIDNRKLVSDDKGKQVHSDDQSNARERHLFNMQKSKDDKVLCEIEKYSLGSERSLRDYERFSGINFKGRSQRQHTRLGIFEDFEKNLTVDDVKMIFEGVDDQNC